MTDYAGFQILWGSLASCAPVVNRRLRRVGNQPQVTNLPHGTQDR
jgi:hypothetical protein